MQQRFGNPYSDYVPPEMGGRNIPRSQSVNQGSVQQLPQFGQGQGQMSPMQQMPQGQMQMPMQMQNMGMMQPPPQMMGGMGMMPPGGGSQMQPRGMLPPVEPVPDYSQEEFDPNSFQPPDFSSPEFSSEQNSPQSYAPMPPQIGGPYGQPDMMQMPSSMAQGGSYSSDDPYSIVGLPESYPPTNNPGFADSMPARNFVPQPSEYAPMPSTEQISNAIETEMQSGSGGFGQMGGVSQQGNNQGYGSLMGQGFQPMNNNYPSSMPASMRGGSSVSSSSQNSGGFPPPPPMEPFPIPR
jgi:hypothetical protein